MPSSGTLPSLRANRAAAERQQTTLTQKCRATVGQVTDAVRDIPSRLTQTYRDMPHDEHTFTVGSVSHSRKAGVEDIRKKNEREDMKRRRFSMIELRPRKAESQSPPGGSPMGPSYIPAAKTRWAKLSNRFFYGTTDGASDEVPTARAGVETMQSPSLPQPRNRSRPNPIKAMSLPIIHVEEIRDEDIVMPFGPSTVSQFELRATSLPPPNGDGSSDAVQSPQKHIKFPTNAITSSADETAASSSSTIQPAAPAPTPATLATPNSSRQTSQVTLPSEPLEEAVVPNNRRRLRKARSAIFRGPMLRAMFGRQLAGVVRPALVHLGEGGTLGVHEVPPIED